VSGLAAAPVRMPGRGRLSASRLRDSPTGSVMASSITIHIGRNKTGTSSLQQSLAAGRERLEELGFVYPRPGANHNFLASYFRHKRRPLGDAELAATVEQRAERLRRTIAGRRTGVILSSEALQTARPRQVAEWVGDAAPVRIVIYIREQLDWLASFYQQAVKARLVTAQIDAFAEGYDPDYLAVLAPWEKAFGRDNLVVRVYDRDRLVGGDVVADFLSVVGLDAAAVPSVSDDANPSIGGALLEAKRRVNGLGIEEAALRAATYAPLRRLVIDHPEYRAKPAVPPAFAERFRARYAASNIAVAERYFDGKPLFRPRGHVPADGFGEAEVEVALARLVAATEAADPAMAAEIRRRLATGAAAPG